MCRLYHGPIFHGIQYLGGCHRPVNQLGFFYFECICRVAGIYSFDQESINRCSLGCFTYHVLDF